MDNYSNLDVAFMSTSGIQLMGVEILANSHTICSIDTIWEKQFFSYSLAKCFKSMLLWKLYSFYGILGDGMPIACNSLLQPISAALTHPPVLYFIHYHYCF